MAGFEEEDEASREGNALRWCHLLSHLTRAESPILESNHVCDTRRDRQGRRTTIKQLRSQGVVEPISTVQSPEENIDGVVFILAVAPSPLGGSVGAAPPSVGLEPQKARWHWLSKVVQSVRKAKTKSS